ncbi:hemolysin family protein [Bradyrhizobium sediminis]|uniref:Hemolysin family protein n=1 Tax=Bradyrhizobium sediminis TaxID=2840469 RepID=A0A975NBB0_9BRAD|nr:hemolysin family protein [Bradyrhizobium sediminis]QWG11364.1 hemolysin family protein [Bradyrhizobium sediminis]
MLYLELGIVTVLIVVNGLLSMSELAIVSARPARLAALVEKGVTGSRRALALASDPGKFLSTVQIGITLIGVLSGAFSGATLGQRLTAWLTEAGLSQGLADAIGVGSVVGVITYASLIVGELVPKQIALRDPEAIAVRVAPAMMGLAKASLPLVWLLDRSGKLLLWLLGQRGAAEEKVSEEEIRTLVVEAENAGVLEPGEKEMIAGVMRLGDLPVGAVMTPRHEVDLIDLADPDTEVATTILNSNHSRFPVFDGNRDNALGIVNSKDLLDAFLSGQTPDIRQLIREAPIIPESVDARDVVAILRESPVHIGLVHDEYGTFQGVVTGADILEAIVGAFHTEEGPAEAAFVKRADGSYLISGWMPVLEFADLLGIVLPSSRPYQTFAGFLLQEFGKIPGVGDKVEAGGWRFEIVDLDGRRIDKVLASRVEGA